MFLTQVFFISIRLVLSSYSPPYLKKGYFKTLPKFLSPPSPHRRFIASFSVSGWSLLLKMMRSPDDVIQNVKRALHNTHTTWQSVTNSLQHPETLNIPMGHLEGFFQNRLNLFLIFFSAARITTITHKNGTDYKFLSFHAHTSNPWICSFSVAPPHFVSLATDRLPLL